MFCELFSDRLVNFVYIVLISIFLRSGQGAHLFLDIVVTFSVAVVGGIWDEAVLLQSGGRFQCQGCFGTTLWNRFDGFDACSGQVLFGSMFG